jgi:two-component system NarL family sensor kinase
MRERLVQLGAQAPESNAATLTGTQRGSIYGLWTTCALLVAIIIAGQLFHPAASGFEELYGFNVLAAVTFTVLGGLILPRWPRHPIGWLFVAIGLSSAVVIVGASFAGYRAMAWISKWLPAVAYGLMPLALLIFPEGHLPSRRWRPILWTNVAGIVWAVLCVGFAAWQAPFLFRVPDALLPHSAQIALQIALLGLLMVFGSALAAVASLVMRWRRADGPTRQQLKVLTAGATLVPVGMGLESVGLSGTWAISAMAVPIAAAAAVLRYGLYDVDLFLNRSLVYAVLTLLLLGVYLGLVNIFSKLLTTHARWGPLVATGIVALTFEPARQRLQKAANRLLHGDRDDPYAVVSRLGHRLEQAVDPAGVLPQVAQTVSEALQLPYAAIEVGDEHGPRLVASFGRRVVDPQKFPMTYQRQVVGSLLVTPRSPTQAFTAVELRLLQDLARQAGVAVQAARLTSDLQRSRERLVRSREEERRRLRRDLHDGLGPTLAGMTMQVGAARAQLAQQGQVVEVLGGLEAGLQACVGEVRRLVDDLRPPVLDQLGLLGAIRHRVSTFQPGPGVSAPRMAVSAPDDLPELPAAVEVAAYRIMTEAVTNTVRHAKADRCEVRLRLEDRLIIEVSDDGVGLPARHHPGVGLSSMRERAEELGGSFVAEPRVDGGTLVRAELPLDSQ